MTLPANALFLRRWKLDVVRSKTIVNENPMIDTPTEFVRSPSEEVPPSQPPSGELSLGSIVARPAGGAPQSATSTLLTQDTDLSQLRVTFDITAADVETPNIAIIRVYNASLQTEKLLTGKNIDQSEFGEVELQAGYGDGPLATIFKGTIVQCFRGRENPTDTFILIHAADGDGFYNFCTVAGTLAAGRNGDQDVLNFIKNSPQGQNGVQWNDIPDVGMSTGGVLPRGKVLWGLARAYMTPAARNLGHTWSIQRGEVTFIETDGGLPGEAVEINARNGMIGLPIQTNQGMVIKTLIMPQIRVGGMVHLNNRSIQQALFSLTQANLPGPGLVQPNLQAFLDHDGLYRVFAIDYHGDSRGDQWEQVLTCLAVDATTGKVIQGG